MRPTQAHEFRVAIEWCLGMQSTCPGLSNALAVHVHNGREKVNIYDAIRVSAALCLRIVGFDA